MAYLCRPANRNDMIHIRNMIQELADFERMPDGPKITTEDLIRDCFDSNRPLFQAMVAEADDCIVGYAIFFNIYSTWEGKSLMLEDIYVKPDYRSKGVGEGIFKEVAKVALSTNCCRLDFHVLNWNPAKVFYEKRGAINLTATEDWQYYRLNRDSMANLVKLS